MKSRTYQIYEMIRKKKEVTVDELSEQFGVTAKTIRLDLQALEDSQLVTRTHGGAVLSSHISEIFPSMKYDLRASWEKKEIAIRALRFIKPNSTIILDDGTTNQAIANELTNIPLQIITNDFDIARSLSRKKNISIYFIGGKIYHNESAYHTYIENSREIHCVRKLKADLYFAGTNSISLKDGFMVFNEQVSAIKRTFMEIASQTIIVADSKKFNKASFYRFASFREAPLVITDSSFNRYELARYEKKGLHIIIADRYGG